MANNLICVAWPYVNGELHVGHFAGALLPADIFARYKRAKGEKVLMVSGSDCYGTPITVEADKKKTTPQEIVNIYHPKVVSLFKEYKLDYDIYTKTTTQNHTEVVQELFNDLNSNGFIIKKTTKQFFSDEENKFLPDRYVEGTCPHCKSEHQRSDQCEVCGKILSPEEVIEPYSKLTGSKVILKETLHYFIDLPKLTDSLKKFVNLNTDNWRLDSYQETISFLERGLEQRAITRDIDWGVTIPTKEKEFKNKRFYVWFDAVTGYLSATIEYFKLKGKKDVIDTDYIFNDRVDGSWEEFWLNPSTKHYYFMGKDNLLFHSLIWPAQLIGSGKAYNLPHFIARNQFMNLDGKKFSKSRGWIIDSKYIADKYGLDAIRFYLSLNFPETKDSNFNWKDFVETNNSILVGNIGNFINRTLAFIQNNYDGKVPAGNLDDKVKQTIDKYFNESASSIEKVRLVEGLHKICELGDYGNKYFNDNKIWELAKNDKDKAANCLYNCIQIISALAKLLHPYIPLGAEGIQSQLNITFPSWDWELSLIAPENKINYTGILFKKIDPLIIEEENSKLGIVEEPKS